MGDPRDSTIQSQLLGAIAAFERAFGRRPTLAAFAPGRVNLIGEHTDYNQGFVLPIAIDRQAMIVADFASGSASTIIAHDLVQRIATDLTSRLAPIPNCWSNHLVGVAAQFSTRGAKVPNLDLLLTSTVPIGSGLSSSAAIEVAMATLLEQATGVSLEPLEKAIRCHRAEHEFVGTPCGIMDMYVATHAWPDHAMLIDCRSNMSQLIRFPSPDEAALLVVNTGVRHVLAEGEYSVRRLGCEAAASVLGVNSLRDASVELIAKSALSDEQKKRSLHVVSENARTILAATALGEGNFHAFGELMFASHDSLRDLFEVSCPELDLIVEAARSMPRDVVFGTRMTGGGFGGCAIVLCRANAITPVEDEIRRCFFDQFGRNPEMFIVKPAGACQSLAV